MSALNTNQSLSPGKHHCPSRPARWISMFLFLLLTTGLFGCAEDDSDASDDAGDVTDDTDTDSNAGAEPCDTASPDCESCENCETCEDCDCETCQTCPTCQTCETCDTCDTCEDCDTDTGDETPQTAKYVFFLIGDGMAQVQINAAEYYLASLENAGPVGFNYSDVIPAVHRPAFLNMTSLSVVGSSTTYDNSSYITDSASAGTALACGYKTDNGVLGMNPALDVEYTSIAKSARDAGMKVGIISSVSIDHATPAVFYANTTSRNNYWEIGQQLVASEFDYFGGGGFRVNRYPGTEEERDQKFADMMTTAADNDYVVSTNRAEFDALTGASGTRVIAYNGVLDSSKALPYDMVRNRSAGNDDISLLEFVDKGIEILSTDAPNGFFMMVESGKIDWAGHANDAAANIFDTLHFDEVVGRVLDFYDAHPDETLIIVTGDHECGGMSLGYAGFGYNQFHQILANQVVSQDVFTGMINPLKDSYTVFADMHDIIETNFGFDMNGDGTGIAMTELEMTRLSRAYDDWMAPTPAAGTMERDQWYLNYGGYNSVAITCTHILNEKAGIAWTSYSHTGVNVAVHAEGAGSELFEGYYDNTDIYWYMKAAMGL